MRTDLSLLSGTIILLLAGNLGSPTLLSIRVNFNKILFRPEHLKAWSGPAHLPALWGYGSHTVGDEKLRWLEIGLLCRFVNVVEN